MKPLTPAIKPPLSADHRSVLDALCFVQQPFGVTRLSELLAAGGLRTARGTSFYGVELKRLLAELEAAHQVRHDAQGHWWPEPALARQRLHELVGDAVAREFWWGAWRNLVRFDFGWHLEIYNDESKVGALRVVINGGGTLAAFERLCSLTRSSPLDTAAMLARALLMPFDAVLWERIDPELRLRLLTLLLVHPGDCEATTAPLWDWLEQQSKPRPEVLHDALRIELAQHLILCARCDDARRVVASLDSAEARALRAAADIAEGRYDVGIQGFDAAWKERAAKLGKRKHVFPEALSWFYALALLAGNDAARWTQARKFAAAEAGKRDADAYTFWGVWQAAIDQRLGDAARNPRAFLLVALQGWRLHGLQQLSHLLLAAWLGVKPAAPAPVREHAAKLASAYERSGQHWLAALTRRSAALLLGEPVAAADAALPLPIGAAAEPWREAISAIVALGAVTDARAARPAERAADRLIWTVRADPGGRVRHIEPLEQKAGPRGLGKPRAVALATLVKRSNLPERDAAVLRAVQRQSYTNKLALDLTKAVQALVRHPHVAWDDAPQHFVEIAEGLPALEVLTRGDHLQFRVVDPIRPEPHADDDFDDDDEEEDDDYLYPVARRRPSFPSLLLLRDGPDSARLVRITPAQLRVAELVAQGWTVPVSARAELDAALRVLATHFQLASDADTGNEVPPSSVLHAELTPHGDGLALRLVAAPFGDFGPRLAPGQGRERVTTVHQGLTLSTRRDLAAERSAMRSLLEKAEGLDDSTHDWTLDEPEQALAAVEALSALAPGIVSEWPKGKPLRVRSVGATQVKINVASRADWLEIDGEVALDDGEVLRLRQLLDLVQLGRSRYVALGDGGFLALTDTLRQQLADLNAVLQPDGRGRGKGQPGAQRLALVAALAWAAQSGVPLLAGDAAWRRRSRAWEQAQAQVFELPPGLMAELRDYQVIGWRWLMRLAASGFGAVLADDMGLGKTLQTLGVLLARAAGGPALVVAPTSVCGNWLAEAARFAPGLRVSMYGDTLAEPDEGEDDAEADAADEPAGNAAAATAAGATDAADAATADTPRQAARRRQVQTLAAGDVLVCSYGLLQLDAGILAGRAWDTAVIDEAQAIKNALTRRARAAHALQADFRLALTGTPIENRLGELWSIMGFANPGLLGSAEQFNQRFATPIEREDDAHASRRLRRLVAPFLLRRTKTEVLADLPPRTEIVHEVVPGSKERALLEALRRQAEESVNQTLAAGPAGGIGEGQAQMHILAALTRLRRAACDPRLVAPELGLVGAKVLAFEQLAQELAAGHHKALVFSQFTDFLALLRERLDAVGLSYQYLDGSTPAAQRTQRVAAFQSGVGDLFLISLKAGGFGLNLTMADYVIIADPWWNPAAEDQASGRAHRIGQQRPVTVYRLVTQGSIEDRIVRLHQRKRALAEGVLAGQDGAGPVLGAAELMALLRGDDDNDDEASDATAAPAAPSLA